MLTEKCMHAYRRQYPEDECGFLEPSEFICIKNVNGELRRSPYGETEEEFLDRLERSKQVGRNLFFEEWTIDKVVYKPGVMY